MNRIWRFLTGLYFYFLFSPNTLAAIETGVKPVNSLSSTHLLNWSLGLFVVLALFLFCIWVMKRMGALPSQNLAGIRVLSGLSLGMREKLILVQVGEKQLVLAVTPGKIENLCVLEGQDRVIQNGTGKSGDSEFTDKLKQFMTGTADE